MLDGEEVQIDILDTAGQENYAGAFSPLQIGKDRLLYSSSYSRHLYSQWRRLSPCLRRDRRRVICRSERALVRSTLAVDLQEVEATLFLLLLSEQILRVKNGGTNIPAILVGNKIDLAERRKVTMEEAQQKARTWSIHYTETSAKTKHNVDKVTVTAVSNVTRSIVLVAFRFSVNWCALCDPSRTQSESQVQHRLVGDPPNLRRWERRKNVLFYK